MPGLKKRSRRNRKSQPNSKNMHKKLQATNQFGASHPHSNNFNMSSEKTRTFSYYEASKDSLTRQGSWILLTLLDSLYFLKDNFYSYSSKFLDLSHLSLGYRTSSKDDSSRSADSSSQNKRSAPTAFETDSSFPSLDHFSMGKEPSQNDYSFFSSKLTQTTPSVQQNLNHSLFQNSYSDNLLYLENVELHKRIQRLEMENLLTKHVCFEFQEQLQNELESKEEAQVAFSKKYNAISEKLEQEILQFGDEKSRLDSRIEALVDQVINSGGQVDSADYEYVYGKGAAKFLAADSSASSASKASIPVSQSTSVFSSFSVSKSSAFTTLSTTSTSNSVYSTSMISSSNSGRKNNDTPLDVDTKQICFNVFMPADLDNEWCFNDDNYNDSEFDGYSTDGSEGHDKNTNSESWDQKALDSDHHFNSELESEYDSGSDIEFDLEATTHFSAQTSSISVESDHAFSHLNRALTPKNPDYQCQSPTNDNELYSSDNFDSTNFDTARDESHFFAASNKKKSDLNSFNALDGNVDSTSHRLPPQPSILGDDPKFEELLISKQELQKVEADNLSVDPVSAFMRFLRSENNNQTSKFRTSNWIGLNELYSEQIHPGDVASHHVFSEEDPTDKKNFAPKNHLRKQLFALTKEDRVGKFVRTASYHLVHAIFSNASVGSMILLIEHWSYMFGVSNYQKAKLSAIIEAIIELTEWEILKLGKGCSNDVSTAEIHNADLNSDSSFNFGSSDTSRSSSPTMVMLDSTNNAPNEPRKRSCMRKPTFISDIFFCTKPISPSESSNFQFSEPSLTSPQLASLSILSHASLVLRWYLMSSSSYSDFLEILGSFSVISDFRTNIFSDIVYLMYEYDALDVESSSGCLHRFDDNDFKDPDELERYRKVKQMFTDVSNKFNTFSQEPIDKSFSRSLSANTKTSEVNKDGPYSPENMSTSFSGYINGGLPKLSTDFLRINSMRDNVLNSQTLADLVACSNSGSSNSLSTINSAQHSYLSTGKLQKSSNTQQSPLKTTFSRKQVTFIIDH